MSSLYPFQEAALQALNQPIHLICISPTGSGKSRIYEEISKKPNTRMLLITPLVALARQQFQQLKDQGIPVHYTTSPTSFEPASLATGVVWICSPEKIFMNTRFQRHVHQWKPNFLVVDECHCLWEWGKSFRPSFHQIPLLLSTHKIPRSLWLTATLPDSAKRDLLQRLPSNTSVQGGFEVPQNIVLRKIQVPWINRIAWTHRFVEQQKQTGLIFVNTRNMTKRVHRALLTTSKRIETYHAGRSPEERRSLEEQFRRGDLDCLITTSAFGMGMNIPHLRWVLLWQVPHSLLNLAQAIGRVGRHGQISHATLLWEHEDFQFLDWGVATTSDRAIELQALSRYYRSKTCRIASLYPYFGRTPHRCGRCDVCTSLKDSEG